MSIREKLTRASADLRRRIERNKPLAAVLVITGVLLAALLVSMALGLLPASWTIGPSIEANTTSLEVGQSTMLVGKTPLSPSVYHFEWISSNPSVGVITGEGKEATFSAKEPGETTITFKVDGKAAHQEMKVYSKAYLDAALAESWVYIGNEYNYNLIYPSDSVRIADVYVENTYGQKMADEKFFRTINGEKKLLIASDVDPGNYVLVAKGIAQSDGRTLKTTSSFSALTEILKGYYQFSLSNENLLGIEPWHYGAIENFMKNELGIETSLSNVKKQGKSVDVNSFKSKYVFYRDPTRTDRICYETDIAVKGSASDTKIFSKQMVRASDGTSWTVATDGIIILIYPEGSSYYMNSPSGTMQTVINTNTGTNTPSTTTATTNNNPSNGETNIPSPPPPI
ncbi:MAG TPA: Ig-like domain-containing protein [Candidatus Pacearchaeota archaeon]|nr:Ig-like domain-containing protein [Candidatus Pacearchaeota archaeon]